MHRHQQLLSKVASATTATHCDALQHIKCSALPHTAGSATHSLRSLQRATRALSLYILLQLTAMQCNTPQHTATHYNAMQHTATHCDTLRHTAIHCNTQQHTATHSTACCSVLQCVAGAVVSARNVLQCVAVCCSVLQCVAVCCSVLQCVAGAVVSARNGLQ